MGIERQRAEEVEIISELDRQVKEVEIIGNASEI